MLNKIENKNTKLIVVDNIMKSIDDLYDYVINNNTFKVVSVTGSAGKTTTVGMIEKVLSTNVVDFPQYERSSNNISTKSKVLEFPKKQ